LAGRIYRIEAKDDLNDLAWRVVAELRADSATGAFTDSAALDRPARYYRLVLLP
jgi:hypothetical protein